MKDFICGCLFSIIPSLSVHANFHSIHLSPAFMLRGSATNNTFCCGIGQNLNLLRKVKKLFQHVVDIVRRVPSFVPDYNNVLCQLLPVFEYRIRMGKKIYAGMPNAFRCFSIHLVIHFISSCCSTIGRAASRSLSSM